MKYFIGQRFTYDNRVWTVIKIDKKEVHLLGGDGSECYIDLHSKDPMPESFKESAQITGTECSCDLP